jgi:hypothetical protein
MSDQCRYHVIAIMLLASQHDNKIPFNKSWISRVIQANSRLNWDEILNCGIIECYQDASMLQAKSPPREEKRRVYKEEIEIDTATTVASNSSHPLFEIYKDKNKSLPPCLKLTDDRKEKCRTRCKDPEFLDSFTQAVVKAQGCNFMNGGNDRGWKAGFDWLIANDKNVYKVLEGKYNGLFDSVDEDGNNGQ